MKEILNNIYEFIGIYSIEIILGMGITIIGIIIFLLIYTIKMRKKIGEYQKQIEKTKNSNLERQLISLKSETTKLDMEIDEILKELKLVNEKLDISIKRVGFKRYNSLDASGNELSYSLALLDSHNIGVIITSIYANTGSISYAKKIVDGKSNISLSDEEKEVLDIAMKTIY